MAGDMLTAAEAVALLRISLGIATILNAWEMHALLSGIADGRFAMPLLDWVPAPSSMSVTVYLVLAVGAGMAITAGYRVPAAASISTILSAGVFLWDQQTYSSHRWLALLLVVYLIAARSDSVWSIGRRRSREPSPGPPTGPRTLVMSQLTVCYAFAALSKINPHFLSGQPLAEWIRWELPLTLTLPLAYATVATELFLAAGFWFRRTRAWAALLGVALHVCIVVMLEAAMPLFSFTLTCVGAYALFFVRQEDSPQPNATPLQYPASREVVN